VKVWIYKGDRVTERVAPPASALEKARVATGEQPTEAAAATAAAEAEPEAAPAVEAVQGEGGDATA